MSLMYHVIHPITLDSLTCELSVGKNYSEDFTETISEVRKVIDCATTSIPTVLAL